MTSRKGVKARTEAMENSVDKIRRSIKKFEQMIPLFESFGEAVYGKRIPIRMPDRHTPSGKILAFNDGEVIYIIPPAVLGEDVEHNRMRCGRNDERGISLCPACKVFELVFSSVCHEIAHFTGGSVVNEAVNGRSRSYSKEFGPMLSNLLEDIRIENLMFQAQTGTKVMRHGTFATIFDSINDKEIQPNQWASLGLLSEASDIDFIEFPEDVRKFLDDPAVQDVIENSKNAKSNHETIELVKDLIKAAKPHGFFMSQEEEEEHDETEDESDDSGSEPSDQDEPDSGEKDSGSKGSGEGSPNSGGSSSESSEEVPSDSADSGEKDSSPEGDGDGNESGGPGGELSSNSGPEDDSPSPSSEEQDVSDQEDSDGDDSDDSSDTGEEFPEGNGSVFQDSEEPDGGGDESDFGTDSQPPEDHSGDDSDSSDLGDSSDSETSEGEPGTEGSGVPVSASGSDSEPASGTGESEAKAGSAEDCESIADTFMGHNVGEIDEDDRREFAEVMSSHQSFDDDSGFISDVAEFRWDGRNFLAPNVDQRDLHFQLRGMSKAWAGTDHVNAALGKMRVVFSENDKSRTTGNLRAGKVNTRALGRRAPVQDDRLFKKKMFAKKRDYAVLLVLDVSGSNGYGEGSRLQTQINAAYAQIQLLNRLGIKFSVVAHSGAAYDFLTRKQNNSRYGFANHIGYRFYKFIIKEWDEPWLDKHRVALFNLPPVWVNLDGHALSWARREIQTQRATDRVVMYYSDGGMPAENPKEEAALLTKEIKILKQMRITLAGVGIRSDAPKKYGLPTVIVNTQKDIPAVVDHLEKLILETRQS